ncbi:Aquaporin SIP1-1 [Vitis vinifera]|uniref:Aquaporin SIP1-1 n=1 Tax=Vitis vinifera TaxID=29760 RepID=A0A438G4B0_VITVI|nr:Aquaporin SIP1-1 [Vitis vinifera]
MQLYVDGERGCVRSRGVRFEEVGVLHFDDGDIHLSHIVGLGGSGAAVGYNFHHHCPHLCSCVRVQHDRGCLGWGQLQSHCNCCTLCRRRHTRQPHLHGFPFSCSGSCAGGGTLAIMEVMPTQYRLMLGGPSLKVDLHTGAIAEGVLTFTISFLVLLVVLKGPKSPVLKTWLLAMTTVILVVSGSTYTRPSMNPANAFGWHI